MHIATVDATESGQLIYGWVTQLAQALDVRWHACGPGAGIGELKIPENEPG